MRALAVFIALSACANDDGSYALPVNSTASDGDTIKTWDGQPNIRLAVIDAPEMPGHCRAGRKCVSGDPWAAQRKLQHYINYGHWHCVTLKLDYYRRRLARCKNFDINGEMFYGADLGNLMLASGTVSLYRKGN